MSNAPMGNAHSMVESCDVTTCTFNQANQCHAGAIRVAMVDGMAHCATYTPRGGAMGVGSSAASGAGTTTGTTSDAQRSGMSDQ